jgi:hypothetical protein
MNELAHKPVAVNASLNFAADTTNGGIWSNEDRSLITQDLLGHEVTLQDARSLPRPPSISREGFELRHAPIAGRHWTDRQWVEEVYVPHSLALLREVTGAAHVAALIPSVLIRDTGDAKASPAAEFVHIDQDRASGERFLSHLPDQESLKQYSRATIFNVWRAITPPPQDVPLALCDQRTLDENDWVVGTTHVSTIPGGIPYLSSVFNTHQKWYYFSDLTPDDAIIFKNYDSDKSAPLGCLHGAFKLPNSPSTATPRASTELRLMAFF